MKGNNEFHFNEATMIEAVQEYLNKRMGEFAPTVTSFSQSEYGLFIIETREVEAVRPCRLESL